LACGRTTAGSDNYLTLGDIIFDPTPDGSPPRLPEEGGALGHNYVVVGTPNQEATCINTGIGQLRCDRVVNGIECGKVVDGGSIPIDPYNHGNLPLQKVDAVPGTCSFQGNIACWQCLECGQYAEDEDGTLLLGNKLSDISTGFDKNIHTGEDFVLPGSGYAGTCKTDGWTNDKARCVDCLGTDREEMIHGTTIPKETIPHTWGAWVVTTPATATATGIETRTCSVCDLPETRAYGPLGGPNPTVVPAAVLGATDDTGVLGVFSRLDLVTDRTWTYLEAEYEMEELDDMNIFRTFAPPEENGSYALRYFVLTPALYAELTGDGYTHIEFVMGKATILAPLSAFVGLEDLPVTDTTFALMLDYQNGEFIAGAYAHGLDDEKLLDIFSLLPDLTLTGVDKVAE